MSVHAASPHNVVRIAFIVGAVLVFGLLVWQLAEVWVLVFAAILFATILRSIAAQIERYTPFASPWSLMLAIFVVALIGAAFVLLLGMQLKQQFINLIDKFPQYIADIGDALGIDNLQQRVTERMGEMSSESGFLGTATAYTTGTISALASFVLILIIGIYLAANPKHYLNGFLNLVPAPYTDKIRGILINVGNALRQWLGGQLIIMVIVGTLVSVGLSLIGLPSALALGFMAGIAEFIPILGPILAAAPAILVAFSEDRETLFWVIGLFLLVQQLESYVITPLVQRKAVHLPPVLTILSIVGFGILLGLPGVVMAAPLAVTLMVIVQRLYVRETLDKYVEVSGEKNGPESLNRREDDP